MKPTPYIADQAWRLLVDFDNPRQHLTTAQFRAGRPGQPAGGPGAEPAADAWIDVVPQQVLTGGWRDATGAPLQAALFDSQGQPRPHRRVAIVSDAGIGKTTTIDWLRYRLALPDLAVVAMVVPLHELAGESAQVDERLERFLVDQIYRQAKGNGCTLAQAQQGVDESRRRGRLALLFDGLDQTPAAIPNLQRVLDSPHFANCRVFVAGRPYSIQRHWSELFERPDWLFVRVEEFSVPQQQEYLGTTADNRSRWELLPEEARQILGTPRVLNYVRTIADAELPRLRTAADVYVRAVEVLLREGMANSPEARLLGWKTATPPAKVDPRNLTEGWKLLGAIACEMTLQTIEVRDAEGVLRRVPNFDRIPAGRAFEDFTGRLEQRYRSRTDVGLPQDLVALAALNDVLEHGVFDTDLQGLQEVQFRNRSLQEFLCAYYLATEAFTELPPPGRTAERVAADEAWLETTLYLPDRPETEEYYHVWQFLADMPAERHDASGRPIRGREESSWLRAIAPLYRPAARVETAGGKIEWQSRRSSEMIYRSWWSLNACCDAGLATARTLRDTWLGEFQQICDGGQDPPRQEAALALRDSFLALPPGEFFMGSPAHKQGMPPDQRARWQRWIDQQPRDRPEEKVQAELNQWAWRGRAGQQWQEARRQLLLRALSEQSVDVLAQAWYPHDETPRSNPQQIGGFQLSRQPVSNGWLRLFATGHGLPPAEYHQAYRTCSPSTQHPAIYVSWYDAWAMAKWCHWEGVSCRLPFENEWEYAAKFGQADPWQNYWWGEEFEKSRCNARNDEGKTTVPDPAHASPATQALDRQQHQQSLGLMDLLGNVWEWTTDQYQAAYERNDDDLFICKPAVSRVLRGGAFYYLAGFCRSAYRNHWHPANASGSGGVRLARAE